MIEGCIPVVLCVAIEADAREAAPSVLLLIIRLMTCKAVLLVGRCEDQLVTRLHVAGIARRLDVCAHKRKICGGVMIEVRIPVGLRVTREARSRNTAPTMFLLVVCLVASNAILRVARREDQPVTGLGVAVVASCFNMRTYKWKIRYRVVIKRGIVPRVLSVTFETRRRNLRIAVFFLVILLMASNAVVVVGWRIDERCTGHDVTAAATRLFVCPQEAKTL